MNELQQIITGLKQLAAFGEPAVLATVVRVEGSAYRRPGARMLVTPAGTRVGCVSGGCLERDVRLRGARLAVGEAAIVTYDSTADEETQWTLALGCNGRVDILIERLSPASAATLAKLLEAPSKDGEPLKLATVLRSDSAALPIGLHLTTEAAIHAVDGLADSMRDAGRTHIARFTAHCGEAELLIEKIDPPQRLIIFGGGWDAVPLLNTAKSLGWHVTIADPRAAVLTNPQLTAADVRTTEPDELHLTHNCAVVVMHHDYDADLAAVRKLLTSEAGYVGVLGPRARTERLLSAAGIAASQTLHAPVGLDLGAETPEEIALSVVAEIVAWRTGHDGGRLRDREGSIHGPAVRRQPSNPQFPMAGQVA